MTFPVVLDLVISGAFVLAAFLFYLIKKGNNKRRRENEMHERLIKVESFRLWMVIFSLIIFALKYFFSFVNSF